MQLNDDLLYKTLGKRIKKAREDQKITQGELASRIGLLRTSMTNIESGIQHAPVHTYYQLCVELGLEIADVFPTRAEVTRPQKQVLKSKSELSPKAAKVLESIESTLSKVK